MAMLAERRGKQKYILTPRGKPLYEDESSFGAQMLKKMGWTKGKGLGANEDGNQDFIRVAYKNDSAGIGFQDRDDGWTQHQTQFQDLLKSLNNSQENSQTEDLTGGTIGFGFKPNNADAEKPSPKTSGESLEEKSKKSKVRVHYKKFTKGKDLAQYSEKDLANILGKKSLKNIPGEKQENFHNLEEEERSKTKFGKDIINTGTSINDYFKSKLTLLKAKKIGNGENSFENTEETSENVEENKKCEISTETRASFPEESVIEFQVKKREKHKNKISKNSENSNVVTELNQNALLKTNMEKKTKNSSEKNEHSSSEIKKKKKNKRNSHDDEDGTDPKVKPKKGKTDEEYPTLADTNTAEKLQSRNPEILLSASEEVNKKKRKSKGEKGTETASKKIKTTNISENLILESDVVPENVPKTKKGKSNQGGTKIKSELNATPSKNPSETKVSKNTPIETNSNSTQVEILANAAQEDQNSSEDSKITVSENNTSTDKCIYEISNFGAEKFRYADCNGFPGANIGEIVGYSLQENVLVKVVPSVAANQQVTNMWNYVIKKQEELKKNKVKSSKINFRRFRKKQLFVVN